MKLQSVEITNFRCFEHLTVPLDDRLTVFVANNGGGKTTILDSIARGLAPLARRFGQKPGGSTSQILDIFSPPRKPQQYSLHKFAPGCCLRFAGRLRDSAEAVIWDELTFRDRSIQTRAELLMKLKKAPVGLKRLNAALDDDVHLVASGEGGSVPVFAYYGTNRAVLEFPKRQRYFASAFPREAALHQALEPTSRFKTMFEWFYKVEREELAQQKEKQNFKFQLPVLEAVRRAITSMLPDFQNPRITTEPIHFAITKKNVDGTFSDLYAEQLSDGYRTMLALVMDFARRMAQGNPGLDNPLEGEAILLIDEVDLHLHPIWQQRIVPDLQRTFPNTQFILTTHSPQVLTTVDAGSIKILKEGRLHPCPAPTYGARSSDVVSEVMGLPSLRPPEKDNRVAKLMSEMFAALDAGDLTQAKAKRAELETWAKGFPEPDLVRSGLLIRRLESQLQNSSAS